jgi:hypothetical protein
MCRIQALVFAWEFGFEWGMVTFSSSLTDAA